MVGVKAFALIGQSSRGRIDKAWLPETLSDLGQCSGESCGAVGEPEQGMAVRAGQRPSTILSLMLQQMIPTEHSMIQGSGRTVLQKWADQTDHAPDQIKPEVGMDVVWKKS